ncbi:MAG: RNA-binding protein [Clostridia bacterium]|nr:RNA-binding protein [Clostridia bacterium]
MNKTELLNKLAQSGEERLLLARVMDKLELSRQRDIPAHTFFLSTGEKTSVERLIAASGHPRHAFWGGYEGAERAVCAFLPDWQEPEDLIADDQGPLTAVTISYPSDAALTHRDFLGSILGLGITREKVGDLLVGAGRCQAVLLEEAEHILLTQLTQVGRQKVSVSPCALAVLTPPEKNVKLIRDTVATLRLDAVASSGFSLSRSKMADLISSKRLTLNGRECDKPDRAVAEGDVLACRGLGKCMVKEVGGQSKKGRIMLVLERYI